MPPKERDPLAPPPGVRQLKVDGLDRLILGARIPEDDLTRLRARLVVSIALLSVPFWVFYGSVWYAAGLPRGLWLTLAAACGCLLCVPALRFGLSPQLAGRGIAAIAALTFFCLALFVRGFDLPLLTWNLLIPATAVLFRGVRTAYAWMVALTGSWLFLWWLDHQGLLPAPHSHLRPAMLHLLDLFNLVGVMLLLIIIVGSHARVVAKQQLEREELRKQLTHSEHLASLGTLAASIGHEINNPLAYTIHNLEYLCAERIRTHSAPEEQTRALSDALEGAKRVQRITARLNAFARRSADPRPMLVDQAVQVALDLARSALNQVAQVVVKIQPALSVRATDELVQVLLNVLVNAADAIGTDSDRRQPGIISVTATAEGDHVLLEVKDNGPGMTEEVLERIFDPFFTTKDPGRGTGLGLAISQQIVTQLAGTIAVSSLPAQGTVVSVRLPLTASVPPAALRVPSTSDEVARVLIVDDEPALLRAMKRHLKDYQIDTVSDGKAALSALANNRYALVLCDVMMPKITGPDLYLQTKQELGEEVASLFVFMTGGAFLPEQARALKETGCPTLPKPIDASLVSSELERRSRRSA